MAAQLLDLALILLVCLACPYLASLIPGRPVPEVVFLVFAGAILGPMGVGIVSTDAPSIQMLSQLGMAFLFLMAGYELDPQQLTGPMGRHACLAWAVSLAAALLITPFLPLSGLTDVGTLAFAIAMTTTAYGTLAPIMRDRALTGTPVGEAVTVYGAIGELLPVIAMAFLLSSRSWWLTAVILGAFLLICLRIAKMPDRARRTGSKVLAFLRDNAETVSQATVRVTVALLVTLVAISALFDLDVVLGAFAAGFILRHAAPEGDHVLETKLDAIAYGFLVPVFFFVSGASVDLTAAFANPLLLVGFMGLLLLVRALPVGISLRLCPETRGLTVAERLSCSIYCSMALPLIVAITSVATESGAMSDDMASVLVMAGACTVLVVPVVTSLFRVVSSAHPVEAMGQIAHEPSHMTTILHDHVHSAHTTSEVFHRLRDEADQGGTSLSSTDFLAHASARRAMAHRIATRADKASGTSQTPDAERGGQDHAK
ncbi:MAG: cation:proton antiporter [Atopobiaceae bacterium]|jgi:Kef-type K+ transport system membrane component KefB|nr:cation:proton antiporter [Atopobiaceae bacterium]MCH4214970.1 cation:proton antiporter [Atopobiaceae bacterium]